MISAKEAQELMVNFLDDNLINELSDRIKERAITGYNDYTCDELNPHIIQILLNNGYIVDTYLDKELNQYKTRLCW